MNSRRSSTTNAPQSSLRWRHSAGSGFPTVPAVLDQTAGGNVRHKNTSVQLICLGRDPKPRHRTSWVLSCVLCLASSGACAARLLPNCAAETVDLIGRDWRQHLRPVLYALGSGLANDQGSLLQRLRVDGNDLRARHHCHRGHHVIVIPRPCEPSMHQDHDRPTPVPVSAGAA